MLSYKEFKESCKKKRINTVVTHCYGVAKVEVEDDYMIIKAEKIGLSTMILTCVLPEEKAKAFFEELKEKLNSNGCSGIASEYLIAEKMEVPVEQANEYMWACVYYHITERSEGMFIV